MECSDIIPYTSYPNEALGLYNRSDYESLSGRIMTAVNSSCSNHTMMRWGACNMLFPRCLMGYDLLLCRNTCLGKGPAGRSGLRVRNASTAHTGDHFVVAGVEASCSGDGKAFLQDLCMQMPEEGCLPGDAMDMMPEKKCDEHEFACGDGQCVHGLTLCDHKFDCRNGADELRW